MTLSNWIQMLRWLLVLPTAIVVGVIVFNISRSVGASFDWIPIPHVHNSFNLSYLFLSTLLYPLAFVASGTYVAPAMGRRQTFLTLTFLWAWFIAYVQYSGISIIAGHGLDGLTTALVGLAGTWCGLRIAALSANTTVATSRL